MKTNKFQLKTMIAAVMLIISVGANAQNYNDLGYFNKIEISGNIAVTLVQSESNKIESKNEERSINYKMDGNKLVIKSSYANESIIVYVKNLEAIEVSGVSSIKSRNVIIAPERFAIESSGNSSVNIELNTPLLKCEATGVSEQTIKGKGDKLVVDISGNADLNAFDFIANDVVIDASGVSEFNITANKKLVLDASGNASGKYKGTPASKVIQVNGIASVKAIDENETFSDERSEVKVGVEGDTVAFNMGNRKIIITEKNKKDKSNDADETATKKTKKPRGMKDVWSGLEMGFDNLITPTGSYSFDKKNDFLNTRFGSSYHVGLNLFEPDWQIVKGRLSVASGFGIEWQSFRFDNDRQVLTGGKSLNAIQADTILNTTFTSNRLSLTSFTLPILIKLNSNADKSGKRFHVAAGVIVNYTPWATVKTETTSNGYEDKREFDYSYNINPLRLTATVRVGYGWLRLFANYGITPVFKPASAPDTRVASIGLTIIPF